MKASGIVRNIDDLGRIVIPKEIRKRLEIEPGTPVEIFVNGSSIVLEKYSEVCVLCGGKEGLFSFDGKFICRKCKKGIVEHG